MARRSLHLTISALVLLALLLSARLSAPVAVAAPSSAKVHVALTADTKIKAVLYNLGDTADISAVQIENETLGKHEYLQIRNTSANQSLITCHGNPCDVPLTEANATTIKVRAYLVDTKSKKVVAKSNVVMLTWKQLPLNLSVYLGDLAFPGSQPDSYTTYMGNNDVVRVEAPQGMSAAWKDIGIFTAPDATPDKVELLYDCGLTSPCEALEEPPGKPGTWRYRAAAVVGGKIVAQSQLVTVEWKPWTVKLTINGVATTGKDIALARNEQAKIEATTTDPIWSTLKKETGLQEFDLTIQRDGKTIKDCHWPDPCQVAVDAPAPGEPEKSTFAAIITSNLTGSPVQAGTTMPTSLSWRTPGYAFQDLKVHYFSVYYNRDCDPASITTGMKNPACVPETVDVTISGQVCGDPYKDTWNIHNTVDETGWENAAGPGDTTAVFDPTTEEVASGTFTAARDVFAVDKWLEGVDGNFNQYIHFYLHGAPDSNGNKIPSSAEVSWNVPATLADQYIPTATGGGKFLQFHFEPAGTSVSAKVVAVDCP